MSKSNTSGAHLVRQIGLGSGIAIIVGTMIGSGIFKNPSVIAGRLPGPLPMMGVWAVGGILVLCAALTLSEVGGAFPYSGGLYVYIREAYGRLPAFLFGWAQLVLLRPASTGAVAIVFGQYALRLTGLHDGQAGFNEYSAGLAIGALLAVSAANVLGVRFGTGIQNLMAIAKTFGLLILIVLALVLGLPHAASHFSPAVPQGSFSPSMFGLAIVSVLWAYDGWADGTYVSGEILNPRRNVPRAILFGVLTVMGIYLMANFGYLSVFSVQEIGKSQIIAADTMAKLVGVGGVSFIIATVMLSTFGTLNGSMLTSPRIFFAMAEDRLFFRPLSLVHPRFKTPYVSVMLVGCLGILYVLVATMLSGSKAFASLTDAFVIGIVPFYLLAVGSVFVFRKRERHRRIKADTLEEDSLVDPVKRGHLETHPHPYDPPVHTPIYPLTPLIYMAAMLAMLANSLVNPDSQIPTLITLAILLAGVPIYYATIARAARRGVS